MLDSGQALDAWREANVTPIFKKGSRAERANYRPVSLTPVLCKVFEACIKVAMMTHLVQLFCRAQHGFVPRKSCATNLLECLDLIGGRVAVGHAVDAASLDYWKAFDTIPHERPLVKVGAYGFRGKITAWIRAFLTDRRQRVVIGDVKSDWIRVKSEVPQGYVLGPLMFVIFINDLADVVTNKLKLYADDSKLLCVLDRPGARQSFQDDLNRISVWCETWQMQLNADKCKIMHFGQNNPHQLYYIAGRDTFTILESSDSERDLGVQVRNDLKWGEQVYKAASKANQILGMLRRTFQHNSLELWKKLYTAYVTGGTP